MRILVISNYSGALITMRPEASIFFGLKKLGLDITVMTSKQSELAQEFQDAGIRLIDHRPTKKISFKTISLIRKTIKDFEIDIVQTFNSKATTNASLALIGLPTKLVSYRGYTGNIHWYDPSCYVSVMNPRIDRVICLAESVRELFLKNGFPAHKPITVNKGHKLEWYSHIKPADLSEFNIPKNAMVCSFVANNRVKMKGIEHLVKATYLIPEKVRIYFLMMGKGLDTPEVLNWISQSPHKDKFIFTGFRKDVSELVKACDISISTSQFGEATQKAMIEAMFLGNPVIITDISGNKGMVKDGEGGYIVAPGSAIEVKEALIKFYNHRDRIPEMGAAAQTYLSQKLSVENTVNGYYNLYKTLLNED